MTRELIEPSRILYQRDASELEPLLEQKPSLGLIEALSTSTPSLGEMRFASGTIGKRRLRALCRPDGVILISPDYSSTLGIYLPEPDGATWTPAE